MHEIPRGRLVAYSVAVLAPAVSLLVRWPLWPVLGDAVPHMTFFPAVMIAAYLGGFWPGLLATLVSAVAANYFLTEQLPSFQVRSVNDVVALILFVLVGAFMSSLCEALHRVRRRNVADERRRAEEFRNSAERLENLARRLLEAQEAERRHLARELYDESGQTLATITLHLHAARGLAGEAALPRLHECATLLQQVGLHVRNLALGLRPTMLDTLGPEATLRWLAEQYQQRTGCEAQVVGHLCAAPLSPEMAIACFRVAQEALANVARHAAARHAWIELSQSETTLELIVRDDGVGFDVAPTQEQAARRWGLGLLGTTERVHLLGGTLQVESAPGRGTRLRASFPLTPHDDEAPKPKE